MSFLYLNQIDVQLFRRSTVGGIVP